MLYLVCVSSSSRLNRKHSKDNVCPMCPISICCYYWSCGHWKSCWTPADCLYFTALLSGWHPQMPRCRARGPGARRETPADQPVRNNEEQRCMAPGPMSPTVPVVLTPHILWGLRHSLGCHGSLASLKMNLHSGLTPWLINTDRERMESDRNG